MLTVDIDGTSENLKKYREKNNLTKKQLATLVSVTATAVYKWENSMSLPSLDILMILSEVYNCTLDDLVISKHFND